MTQIADFFNQNQNKTYKFSKIPADLTESWQQAQWIMTVSQIPYLPLDISGPWKEMYQEALALDSEFQTHRSDGDGWSSLCIHGLSAKQTESPDQYTEYANLPDNDLPYTWTEIIDRCPVTAEYFKNNFPFDKYARLRYMKLAVGGEIPPHVDGKRTNPLNAINIALNNPSGCQMVQEDSGTVPFSDLGGAILFNNTWTHAVRNTGPIDRYHIIVHGMWNREFNNIVVQSYKKLLELI